MAPDAYHGYASESDYHEHYYLLGELEVTPCPIEREAIKTRIIRIMDRRIYIEVRTITGDDTMTDTILSRISTLDDHDLLMLIDYLADQLSSDPHDAMPSLAAPFEQVEDERSYPAYYPGGYPVRTPKMWAAWSAYRDARLGRLLGELVA